MRRRLYLWIKANGVMFMNAGSLVGTTLVTLALGFPYWWLAARLFTPAEVGVASAAISAMMLLGAVCVLGMGTLLIGELPRQRGKEGPLISAALLLVGALGGGVAVVFALLAQHISMELRQLSASYQTVLLFAAGVSFTAVTIVLDQACTGLLRSEMQLWRNLCFSIIKLASIFLCGVLLLQLNRSGLTIYATWAFGNLCSLLLIGIGMVREVWSRTGYRPHWGLLRNLGPAAVQHHLLNLALQAPGLILPVLVTVLLSAEVNAWFYVSWMIANLASLIPYVFALVLYAITSGQQERLAQQVRLTVAISIVACLLAACVILFSARFVLGLFGSLYAAQAEWSLRILTLAAFPRIIKEHYIAINRVQGRIVRAVLPMAVGALLELGAAAAGARLGGLSGLSAGWVLAVCAEAAFGFYPVYRTARPRSAPVQVDPLVQAGQHQVSSVNPRS